MQAQAAAVEDSDAPVVVPYATLPARPAKSSCLKDTLDLGLLLTFPCAPMARTSASVGMSYAGVFVAVALVYGGGIACFGAAAAVDHPLFEFSAGHSVLVAWIFSISGLAPSMWYLLNYWAFASAKPSMDDDPDTTFDASDASQALVASFMFFQLLFLAGMGSLRNEILERSGASSCCSSSIGSCCCTCCFPSCSFAEAMQKARAVQDQQGSEPNGDELPAYMT